MCCIDNLLYYMYYMCLLHVLHWQPAILHVLHVFITCVTLTTCCITCITYIEAHYIHSHQKVAVHTCTEQHKLGQHTRAAHGDPGRCQGSGPPEPLAPALTKTDYSQERLPRWICEFNRGEISEMHAPHCESCQKKYKEVVSCLFSLSVCVCMCVCVCVCVCACLLISRLPKTTFLRISLTQRPPLLWAMLAVWFFYSDVQFIVKSSWLLYIYMCVCVCVCVCVFIQGDVFIDFWCSGFRHVFDLQEVATDGLSVLKVDSWISRKAEKGQFESNIYGGRGNSYNTFCRSLPVRAIQKHRCE